MRGSQVVAVRVRCGDLVRVKGEWREVRRVRDERFPTGGAAVVLLFERGAPLRVSAGDLVEVSGRVVVPASVDSPADWALTPDRSGTGPVTEVECTTCLEGPGPVEDQLAVTAWCVAHGRGDGHDGFRRIVTDFHRVVVADRPD